MENKDFIWKGKHFAVTKDKYIYRIDYKDIYYPRTIGFSVLKHYIHNILIEHRSFTAEDFERIKELQYIYVEVLQKELDEDTQLAIDAALKDTRNLSFIDDVIYHLEAEQWEIRTDPLLKEKFATFLIEETCKSHEIFAVAVKGSCNWNCVNIDSYFDYLDQEDQIMYIRAWEFKKYMTNPIEDTKIELKKGTSPEEVAKLIIKTIEEKYS